MGRRSRGDPRRPAALIAVDTSVWTDHFRGLVDKPHVQALRRAVQQAETVVVGDVVLMELLIGVADERRSVQTEAWLRQFSVEPMLDDRLAVVASRHYRTLRGAGVTVRKTVDLVIGTFCIDRGYRLLHNDRDFEPMHALLGLRRA